MKSLFKYLEDIYNKLPSLAQLDCNTCQIIKQIEFKELIDDDKKCLKLISSTIEFPAQTLSINQHRASHIIVTWILGVGLSDFVKDGQALTGLANLYETRIWLETAMIHDYGYFCQEIKKCLPIENLTKDYNLLTDNYDIDILQCLNNLSTNQNYSCFFSYSYVEIKNYYHYIQSWHQSLKNNSVSSNESFDDFSDHGIVGGCKAFSKYCKHIATENKYNKPSDVITIIQKLSCINAASHNIFKSSPEKDKKYIEAGLGDLTSESPSRITRTNFFLSLLSLVDTIECVKRFSKKDNPREYLIQSTILDKVDFESNINTISINFNRLDRFISNDRKSNKMKQKLKQHIDAITKLDEWTDFKAIRNCNDKNLITISFKDRN